MKASKQHQLQQRGCKTLCCSRVSISSSELEAESSVSDRFPSVSSLAHAMVQERLDQMIRESLETKHVERRRRRQQRSEGTKFVVMVAMEKSSYDPRKDFRESMMEMITANLLQDAKDLRNVLNYYMSMNSKEYHSVILEVFHENERPPLPASCQPAIAHLIKRCWSENPLKLPDFSDIVSTLEKYDECVKEGLPLTHHSGLISRNANIELLKGCVSMSSSIPVHA